jgi:sulfite reductase beta subunit-like hemoprotein
MATPDIPAAKRSGLPVDIERLTVDGDDWLSPEERYALKTYGVCPQTQPGMFMVRIRVPGGVLLTSQAHGLARLARRFGPDWLHLTTRQSVELHWVKATDVPALLEEIERLGLSTRSTCGHTLRNVMCSEDAGLGLDEPFDCFVDARLVSDTIVARSEVLNVALPGRLNVLIGGSARCREDALINDLALVSCVRDGEACYEVWGFGSLGKSPRPGIRLSEHVSRTDALAAVEAMIDLYVAEGDHERPAKGRLKWVLERLGAEQTAARWNELFEAARSRPRPPAPPVDLLGEPDRVAVLSRRPPGGWGRGVRPQRTPGLALVTIDVPMGDTCGAELELLADLADRHGDGALMLTRDQNLTLRNVELPAVSDVRSVLSTRGLHIDGESETASMRACTGSDVCSLGITDSPGAGRLLTDRPSLRRNPALRVHISGCPNSCAQHQAGDLGLAGSKVRIGGRTTDGYHLFVGADMADGILGEPIGRVAEEDLPAAVDAMVGVWESLRRPSETIGTTVRRVGLDAIGAQLEATLAERWSTGAEPELTDSPTGTPTDSGTDADSSSRLVPST